VGDGSPAIVEQEIERAEVKVRVSDDGDDGVIAS